MTIAVSAEDRDEACQRGRDGKICLANRRTALAAILACHRPSMPEEPPPKARNPG